MRKLTLLAFVVVALACAGTESGTVGIITSPGDGGDPFTEPPCTSGDEDFCGPAPTSITVSEITIENADGGTSDGNEAPNVLGSQPYDGGATINLPPASSDDVEILQATAYDSAHMPIIFGETLPVQLGGLGCTTLPLFVQREGQFATMPSSLVSTPASPIATVFEKRYIFVADSSGKSNAGQLYDLLLWGLAEDVDGGMSNITLPCSPAAMAPVSGTTFVLLVCAEGASASPAGACAEATGANGDLIAWSFDVSGLSSCNPQVLAPSGFHWSDVAGGSTVIAPNGDAFIVGATRATEPATSTVIRVPLAPAAEADAGTVDVKPTGLSLNAARTGAAAVWSGDQHGLVVLGGVTASGASGGIESSVDTDAGANAFACFSSPHALPENAGVVAPSDTTLLVAGGTIGKKLAPILPITLGIPTACVAGGTGSPEAGADGGPEGGADAGAEAGSDAGAGLTLPLTFAQGFIERRHPTQAVPIFVGTSSADGTTKAYLVGGSQAPFTVSEVPLRNPKRTATTAILSPIPEVVVMGGDTTMESYIP